MSLVIVDGGTLSSGFGPRLPTWALQQVVGYLGYTGRDVDVVATAAHDPKRNSRGSGRISIGLNFVLNCWRDGVRRRDLAFLSFSHNSVHLGRAYLLVLVHRHYHFGKTAREREGSLIVRDRRPAIASNVETGPRDKVEKAKPRLGRACRDAVDQ